MKYSIIVPVYKVEAYLPRCIESILNQTVSDFELILVDDGSPDRSGAICDEYAARDRRIKVIHQANGGVSRARNAGLDAAQGKYIVFIDSDDYVDGTYLQCFAENSADMIICGYTIERYGYSEQAVRQHEYQYIDTFDQKKYIALFEKGLFNYVWARCVLASIIRENGLRFNEGLSLAEDTLFSSQCAAYCHTICILSTTGYHYLKYEHETLTGIASPFDLIQKLEHANEILYSELKAYLQEDAMAAVAKRIGLLYKDILAESLDQRARPAKFVYYLFKQTWFRRSLDYVDEIYADEDPKYRALLKTKSSTLFCLYRAYVRMRNR